MTPSNISFVIGGLLVGILTAIVMGYGRDPQSERCKVVSEVYRYSYAGKPPLRGSSDDGLNLAESFAIDTANTVSNALGVSCYIDGFNT